VRAFAENCTSITPTPSHPHLTHACLPPVVDVRWRQVGGAAEEEAPAAAVVQQGGEAGRRVAADQRLLQDHTRPRGRKYGGSIQPPTPVPRSQLHTLSLCTFWFLLPGVGFFPKAKHRGISKCSLLMCDATLADAACSSTARPRQQREAKQTLLIPQQERNGQFQTAMSSISYESCLFLVSKDHPSPSGLCDLWLQPSPTLPRYTHHLGHQRVRTGQVLSLPQRREGASYRLHPPALILSCLLPSSVTASAPAPPALATSSPSSAPQACATPSPKRRLLVTRFHHPSQTFSLPRRNFLRLADWQPSQIDLLRSPGRELP